jgi:chemotaxis family two-component system sensor kinase Cph1
LQVHQIELEMQNEELRRAQQELEVSRTRYFDLYDLAPVGYLTLSEGGLVLEANLTAAQLLGVERNQLAGQALSRFIVRDDQDIYYLYRKKLFETGVRQVCEVRMSREGGNQFWTRLETTTAQNGESEVPVYRTVMSDITGLKQAEEALRKARDELEVRVQERTAELQRTSEDLRIHATLLEQSNRDLEDFAHVVSHDLQEPLRKIQTFAERIATVHRDSLDDKTRDYLDRMQRAAEGMQTLVQDLLRYSRITSKAEPFTRFNLRAPVEEAMTDLGVLCEETEARIEVDELPEVKANQVQMRQLFQNLIGNGLKYRGDDKPVIRIYSNTSSSGLFWEIHVEDNGIGFDEIYLDRIFKPFQRLHGRRAPYQGTGMGLAICRTIVERHGGSITAKSEQGKGSTFIVTFPKKQQHREKRS